ncbi:MAG TPA: hypothetical protein VGQ62_07090, partial [Chloroflexota bacterium]|nr:hypothetical protein [Chloroflexota bacterium]
MRHRNDWTWSVLLIVAGALLFLLAAGRIVVGLRAIVELQQLDYGEPIVYGIAARLVAGQPLYQPLDHAPFTVAAYTPLYYALAAAGQGVLGSGFGPGRALSFLSGLVASAAVGWLVARQSSSRWAG